MLPEVGRRCGEGQRGGAEGRRGGTWISVVALGRVVRQWRSMQIGSRGTRRCCVGSLRRMERSSGGGRRQARSCEGVGLCVRTQVGAGSHCYTVVCGVRAMVSDQQLTSGTVADRDEPLRATLISLRECVEGRVEGRWSAKPRGSIV